MWCQVEATAAVSGQGCPLVRSKHAMCFTSDGHIYLYGGRSPANKALADLWRFDTAQNQWEEVVPRLEPEAIGSKHAHHYCLNGRNQSQQHQYCGNLLDEPKHGRISSNTYTSSGSSSPSTPPENKFEPPPPLQEHSIVAAKNKLYLFGGQVGYSCDETPLWIFDLASARWRKFSVKSSPSNATSQPPGRRGHSAVLYKNKLMSIYGGYQDLKGSTSELWTFDIENEKWTKEGGSFQNCASPPARHAHSAVVFKDAMYIYGGMTDLQVRGDFWCWNYKNKTWNRIKSLKNPGELCCHSAIVVTDSMFIYGGERGNGNSISELWQYRFASQSWNQITVAGIVPGCRTRHVAVGNPFLNVFGSNWNPIHLVNESACIEQPQQQTTDLKCHCHAKKEAVLSPSCKYNVKEIVHKQQKSNAQIDPSTCSIMAGTNPRKSFSLQFDSLNEDRTVLSSIDNIGPKKKIIKSHSFRENTSSSSSNGGRCLQSSVLGENRNEQQQHETDQHQLYIKNSRIISCSLAPIKVPPTDDDLEYHSKINSISVESKSNVNQCIHEDNNHEKMHQNESSIQFQQQQSHTKQSQQNMLVKLRPRRPMLQRQRPYSDFYGNTNWAEEFEAVEMNEQQFKRRSVQESMSYYSLCFATPPASVKQSHSPVTVYMSPVIEPSSSENKGLYCSAPLATSEQQISTDELQHIDLYCNPTYGEITKEFNINNSLNTVEQQQKLSQFMPPVRRRENSEVKRQMRRANLKLQELNNALSNAETGNFSNAYYSLSLVSPDFEKELRCASTPSSPSNELGSSHSLEEYAESGFNYQHGTQTGQVDLDLIEDYLEPEEMLEIVTDHELSPTLQMTTIKKTPARIRQSVEAKEKQFSIESSESNCTQTIASNNMAHHRHPSVSHSSSGYQSLILTEGGSGAATFDLTSDPSTSNSPLSANDQDKEITVEANGLQRNEEFIDNLKHSLTRSITQSLVDSNNNGRQTKNQNVGIELRHLRSLAQTSTKHGITSSHRSQTIEETRLSAQRARSLERLADKPRLGHSRTHWEPNIKEVIQEVIVPRSPAVAKHSSKTHKNYNANVNKLFSNENHFVGIELEHYQPSRIENNTKKSLVSIKRNERKIKRASGGVFSGDKQNWQLCMYVFGGKEGTSSGKLNKEPITIWKLYI